MNQDVSGYIRDKRKKRMNKTSRVGLYLILVAIFYLLSDVSHIADIQTGWHIIYWLFVLVGGCLLIWPDDKKEDK